MVLKLLDDVIEQLPINFIIKTKTIDLPKFNHNIFDELNYTPIRRIYAINFSSNFTQIQIYQYHSFKIENFKLFIYLCFCSIIYIFLRSFHISFIYDILKYYNCW